MSGHPTDQPWLYRAILRAMTATGRRLLADRRLQERIVRESGLDRTLVDRADLARYLLDGVDNPATSGARPRSCRSPPARGSGA